MGKGTVISRLLQRVPELHLSVSVTTRSPRAGERQGVDYDFTSDERFDQLVEVGSLLEWAQVFGRRYGTPSAPLFEATRAGRDVVLEIDVQGAQIVRERMPDAVLIFLAPPSREVLLERLRARGTEEGVELARRLAEADGEIAQQSWFDHVVTNDDPDEATAQVAAIIQASRNYD